MRNLLRRPSLALVTLVTFGVLASGCSQIVRGSSADVFINSAPAGATVSSTMGAACQTPCALSLPRKDMQSLTINLPGYEPAHVQLMSELSVGWLVIDVLFTGFFVVISLMSGGVYDLEPSSVFVTLHPLADGAPDRAPMVVEVRCTGTEDRTACNIVGRPELAAR